MKKNNIYDNSEIPDHTLEEFEKIRDVFLEVIYELSKDHDLTTINAGMSRANLDFLLMANPKKMKNVLINQSYYFFKAAENIED